MGFNDWIYVEPAKMAIDQHPEEIDALAKEKLSQKIQERLRGTFDDGRVGPEARRAQSIRVKAEGSRLVISEEAADEVLRGNAPRDPTTKQKSGVESLFQMSSGVPDFETMPDGTIRTVFRRISADSLFEAGEQETQDERVKSSISSTVQGHLVDAYEDAASDIEKRYPEERQ